MSDQKKAPDFSSLTENLSQQQAKISALKELVRQSESQQGRNTASAQEKVKNIAQRLSNIKTKASRSKLHRAGSEASVDDFHNITHIEEEEHEIIPSSSSSEQPMRAKSETPGSEKITLLCKQMELNRLKMAERESKSKEIEQMVTQLKSKFETSQMSLEKSVELGRSMGDLSAIPSMLLNAQHRSVSDISRTSHPINLENERIKFLEKRIRDLESELDSKAVALSENEVIVQLERKILDLEENIREKDSIIEARTKAVSLLSENLTKKKKDVVDSLEDTKQEMFKMQEAFLDAELSYKKEVAKLNRALHDKSDEIKNLNEKCEILEKSRYDLTIENSDLKSKLEDVQDYSTKISELNKLNESLQKRISTLESQGGYEFITDDEVGEAKREDIDNKVKELEELIKSRNEEIEQLQENLQEKTIEVNVVNANLQVLQEKYSALGPKPLFTPDAVGSEETQAEINKLKQQLDESNKSMIKTKLKMKQMQKQIDTLSKSSDGSQEITRLNEEVQSLTQKIAVLEEEKGSYQLEHVGDSETEVEKKIKVLETTCQNQNAAIQLLEEQKAEMSEDLSKAKQSVDKSELEQLEERIRQLTEEKDEINTKMNQYLNENMELLDKLEKISKGSSAESIEMVANLTAQEKFELEEYQKGIVHKDEEIPAEISQELNESLKCLRMESSELMEKIELFTVERREVLEKLDALTIENQILSGNFEKVNEEKLSLENDVKQLRNDIDSFEKSLSELKTEKEELLVRLSELSDHRTKLQEEINKLVKQEISTPQGSPLKTAESTESSFDREACEKLLKQLDSEIQNLNKNKDKNQKLKISKKLSDNAKNVHAMMTNLLIEFYKNLDECKELREDMEKVKILLNNVSSDKNNEEVHNLEIKLAESLQKLNEKSNECEELQSKLSDLKSSNEENFNDEIQSLKTQIEILGEETNEKDDLIKKMQSSIETLTNERDHCEIEVQKQMTLVSDLRKEFDQLVADVKLNNQRLNEKSSELDHLQHEFDMRLKTSTSEVEILKTLVAEQKQLLIDAYQEHELDINQKIKEIEDAQNEIKKLQSELASIRIQNESNQESYNNDIRSEINKMKELLAESTREIENQKEELLHKQETIDTLNTQIIDLYKSMEENSNKIIEKEDELQYLQEICDSNKEEVRKAYEKVNSSEKMISDLRNQLSSKSREIELIQQKSAPPAHDPKLDERIKQLESENHALEVKSKEQLDKLKKYAATLKKKQVQCSELEEKLAASKPSDVVDHSFEINDLKAKVIQYEEQLNVIKIENSKLTTESVQKSSAADEIEDLRWKIDELESIVDEKTKKIVELEKQNASMSSQCDRMEENTFELQGQLEKLEGEKKKLEENSKMADALQKEVDKLKEEASASKQHESDKSDDKKKMDKLKVQFKHKLADKKKEVEDLQAEIAALKSQSISSSTQEVQELQSQITKIEEMNEKNLSETKMTYEHDLNMLRQQLADLETTNRSLLEDKQRKVSLEGQLETFEMTNIELREKVARLEEAVADFEVERNAFVREKLSLAKELEEKDELIGKKLREMEADNFQMCETIKELQEERNTLAAKLTSIEAQSLDLSSRNDQQITSLQNENTEIQKQVQQLQSEIKNAKVSYDQALAAKHAEIDDMEAELSSQLQKIEAEKKIIQEALEKANDQIVDFQDEVIRLKDNTHTLEQARADLERELSWLTLQNDNYTQDQLENEQLRMQLMQSETELENLRSQNSQMIENHDTEVIILRQQISDLEAMRSQVSQNQTDDQVMLQNENLKLKELLAERENEIQQKAMQLQLFDAPIVAVNDPFANLAAAPPPQQPQMSDDLEEKLKKAHDEIEKIKEAHMMANMELDMQSGKIQEILSENRRLQEKVHEMQSNMDNLIKRNCELEASSDRQKEVISQKDKEINEIKVEMNALRDHQATDDEKLHPLQSELAEKNRAIENLQNILQKYETVQAPPPPQPPQSFGTSMFFSDQPSTSSSLFDDPFSTMQPVVEEEIRPKTAYLCYDNVQSVESQTDEQWLRDHDNLINQISLLQNQLQSIEHRYMEQCMELEAQRQQICELEVFKKKHEAPKPLPEFEEEIVPKKAYLCYDDVHAEYQEKIQFLENKIKELLAENNMQKTQLKPTLVEPQFVQRYFEAPETSANPMAALEIEDGWGWTAESALEEPQQQPASLLSPKSDLEVKLQEQKDIVEQLEREKNLLSEELHNARENSKKMMKKLKEYQHKIKDMDARRSSSVESDMDLVIQEELNAQIQKLESKLKEVNAEREKEQLEREGLNKKVDVLTTANDRMLEMKERQDSQMEMYQLKIRDLSQKLQSLEEWGNEGTKENIQMSPTKENQEELSKKVKELSDQIKDLQVDYDELEAQLEEEKANNKILEEKFSSIKIEISTKEEEFEGLKQQLKSTTSQCETLTHQLNSKNQETNELVAKIDHFSAESSNIKSILDDLRSQVEQKTNENQELNERLQKLEVNNEEYFRYQISEMENQIQSLRAELQYKDAAMAQFNEKNEELSHLKNLPQAIAAKDEEIMQLRTQLSSIPQTPITSNDELSHKLQALEKEKAELLQDKQNMEHELQVLNDQVLASLEFEDRMKNSVLELDAKNIEIQVLKATLDNFHSKEAGDEIERIKHEKEEVERSIDLINAQWSQMVEQRGNEVANSWKHHMEMRETEFAEIENNLQQQIDQLKQATSTETSTPSDNDTILKMKSIMESQEVEIVSLKEQLAIRSAEYASLSAKVDPYHQMSTSMNVSPIPQSDSDRIPRSELDLALYMLHQREMRLEEMTLELVRLLEERDALQLRLSNAIRQMEDVKKKFSVEGESSDQSTPEKSPPGPNAEDDKLQAKLTELNTVRHQKDKAFADDREKRFMENISLFQRDVANMPPEAAARIVQGSDQGQQSPSSVLMNWILGTKPESS